MEHSMSYFNLLDAFSADTCPICALIDKESKRHLHALYYEFVNDAGVRDSLHRSRGFCNWHAWASTEITCSNTGISIIYRDLLNSEIATIREILNLVASTRASRNPITNFRRKKDLTLALNDWKKKEACIVCTANAGATLFHLRELLDHLGEEGFSDRFRASMGLCLPHLKILVEKFTSHPNLPLALEVQIEKYQRLSWELGEFWRKHDYRFAHEPKGAESDSWLRVIKQFVGMREHFGNDLHLTHPSPVQPSLITRLRRKARKFMRGSARPKGEAPRAMKGKPKPPMTDMLLKALNERGCPVCRAGSDALQNYFHLLFKNPGNSPLVARVRDIGGFCKEHTAWLLANISASEKTALMETLVSDSLGKLDAFLHSIETEKGGRNPKRHLKTAQGLLDTQGPCPACQAVSEAEETAIKHLVSLLSHAQGHETCELYSASDGLCMRHLTRVLQLASPETARFLAKDMMRRLEGLSASLGATIHDSDGQDRKGKSGAWRDGLTRLMGGIDPENKP